MSWRLLEDDGYDGAWVDTYGKRNRTSVTEDVELTDAARGVLETIYDEAGHRYGTFDIIAWKGDNFVFAEGKRKGKDRIRNTQLEWLDAALRVGHTLQSFLIVEWDAY